VPILDDLNFDDSACSNCLYWLPDAPGSGYCRRHSPIPFNATNALGAIWPLTHETDYCGDHELKTP